MKLGKLFILTIISIMLVACNDEPKGTIQSESELRYGITTTIDHLNPILTEEGHSELISLIYRGLMKQTEENNVTGDLAKDISVSTDELTYTFTLRQAQWQDGEPITADDIVFTILSIKDPKNASPYFTDFEIVETVRAVDDKTVEITVKEPTPTLLYKLKVGILPKHIFINQDLLQAKENKQPVGNGPYVLEQWTIDETLTFVVNKKYYGKIPSIEQIVVFTQLDENTKLLRLQMGDIHVAQITPQQLGKVESYENIETIKLQTADYRALQFNMEHKQLQDVRVRKAINHMIARDVIQNLVLKGTGEIAYGPLQRSFARYDDSSYQLNVTDAYRLLNEAGYTKGSEFFEKEGEILKFEIVAPITDPIRVSIATILVEQLQVHGIDATLQTKDWSNITIEDEDTFVIGWGSEDDPQTHTYRVFHSSQRPPNGYNYSLINSPIIDENLTNASKGTQIERKAAYEQFQKVLAQKMPFAFLLYLDGIYAYSQQLSGISNRTLGHMGYGLMWNIEEWRWEDLDE